MYRFEKILIYLGLLLYLTEVPNGIKVPISFPTIAFIIIQFEFFFRGIYKKDIKKPFNKNIFIGILLYALLSTITFIYNYTFISVKYLNYNYIYILGMFIAIYQIYLLLGDNSKYVLKNIFIIYILICVPLYILCFGSIFGLINIDLPEIIKAYMKTDGGDIPVPRFAGLCEDPNRGAFLLLNISIFFRYIYIKNWAASLSLLLSLFAISRSVYICILVCILYSFVMFRKMIISRYDFLGFIFIFIIFISFIDDSLMDIIFTGITNRFSMSESSASSHTELIEIAYEIFTSGDIYNMLFGYGGAASSLFLSSYFPGAGTGASFHSVYLNTLIDSGLIVMLCFVCIGIYFSLVRRNIIFFMLLIFSVTYIEYSGIVYYLIFLFDDYVYGEIRS